MRQAFQHGAHVVGHHRDELGLLTDRDQSVRHRGDAHQHGLMGVPDVDIPEFVLRALEGDRVVGELMGDGVVAGRTPGQDIGVGLHLAGEVGHHREEGVGRAAAPGPVVAGQGLGLVDQALRDALQDALDVEEGVGRVQERLRVGDGPGVRQVRLGADSGRHAVDGRLDLLPVPVVVVRDASVGRAVGVAEDRPVVALMEAAAVVVRHFRSPAQRA